MKDIIDFINKTPAEGNVSLRSLRPYSFLNLNHVSTSVFRCYIILWNNWSKIQIVQNLGDTFPVLESMMNKLSNARPCGAQSTQPLRKDFLEFEFFL